eukprot:6599077-Alexandrium_andersonii.AAC.1
MSASLVGSEMCIRDSSRRGHSPRGEGYHGHGHHAVPGAPAPAGRGGQGPVSYTHLTLPTICSV